MIFGQNITPIEQLGCVFSEQLGWAANLRGVEVLVNQKPAPIGVHCRVPQADGLIAETVTCQFPVDMAPGEAEIVVRVNGLASEPRSVTLQSHAPALAAFFSASGQRLGAFQRAASGQLVSIDSPATPGEVLSVLSNGLGLTDPAVAAGEVTPSPAPQTLTAPEVEIDGEAVEALGAALRPGYTGVYEVTFRAPPNLLAGVHRVRLRMAGIASNEELLVGGDPTATFVHTMVNAASFAPNRPAAPGSILSLFVTNLPGAAGTSLFPATEFGGLSVRFNGVPVPLFDVVPEAGQINVLAPHELPESGELDVTIATPAGVSGPTPLALTSASPGIFRFFSSAATNRRYAVAMLANTAWFALPDSVAQSMGLPINCSVAAIHCGRPILPGEPIQLFLTGLGKATPGGDPGAPPLSTPQVAPADGNPLYRNVALPDVTIGGLPTEVAFAGLAPGFAGLYQINAMVPLDAPAGDVVEVRVSTANGLSDVAIIAVRAR